MHTACTRPAHSCGLEGSGVGLEGVAARALGSAPQLKVDRGDTPQHGSVVRLVGEDCATNAPPRSHTRTAYPNIAPRVGSRCRRSL